MTTTLDVTNQTALTQRFELAETANQTACRSTFADYGRWRAQNTLRRQEAELTNFGAYLGPDELTVNPSAWAGISWSIIAGFTTAS